MRFHNWDLQIMAQTSATSTSSAVKAPDPVALDQAKTGALAGFLPVDISLLAAGRRRTFGLYQRVRNAMTETPGALNSMVGLFGKDYYTFTHSVHVCVLGVALYKHMISSKPEDLRRFGLGALLHDVGKSAIDIDILNKPGQLEPAEFEHIKHHPAIGWEMIRRHGVDDLIVQQTILLHHEKLDGNGYPTGATGDNVPAIARIACIVDIYDALTTDRPYRHAMTHAAAMTLMKTRMLPGELDSYFLNGFESIAERFHGAALHTR